jgi:hypothetical protein
MGQGGEPDKAGQQTTALNDAKSEILRLCAQLRRLEDERDIRRGFGDLREVYVQNRVIWLAWTSSTTSGSFIEAHPIKPQLPDRGL